MQNISRGGENFNVGFNHFKDINDEYTTTSQVPGGVTKLAQPLHYNDANLVVIDSSVISPPNTVALRPGIVSINGERILFYDIDGNNLTRLRRGYGGTGVPELHLAGSDVEDVSSLLALPDEFKPPPEFTFTPEAEFQTEGQIISIRVDYKYMLPNVTLWWTNVGSTLIGDFTDSGFTNKGSFVTQGNYNKGSTTLLFSLKADNYTEGLETLQLQIHTQIPPSTAIATSQIFDVLDRSITRFVEILSSNVNIKEGESIHYRINARGYENGTILYWENTGTTRPVNFSVQSMVGEIQLQGTYLFSTADLFLESVKFDTTDYTKTVVLQFYTDTNRQKIVGTSNAVYIEDVERPSFNISPFKPIIEEGESFGWNIYSRGVPPGTTIFCHLQGNVVTTSSADVSISSNIIPAIINGTVFTGCTSISFNSIEDVTTEGWEFISCTVYTDENFNANTYAVGPSNISIKDTSITPGIGLYSQLGLLSSISFGSPTTTTPLVVSEGQSITITLLTEGIEPGSIVYLSTSGNATSPDFQSLNSVYPLTINGSYFAGTATLSLEIQEDLSPYFVGTPEGTETLTLTAYLSNPNTSPLPPEQGNISIQIQDTSLETTTTTTTEPPSLAPPPGAVLDKFFNGDFEIPTPQSTDADGVGHIPGWSIYSPGQGTTPAHLRMNGFSQILGKPTPNDPSPVYASTPSPYGDQDPVTLQFFWSIENGSVDSTFGGKNILKLTSQGSSVSFGVGRGPYVVSDNPIDVAAGDNVYFHWKAEGGWDAFDVFGYLIEQDPNEPAASRSIILLNSSGPEYGSRQTPWERVERTIQPGEDGIYKFVFVCGTYDESGGRALGATLYLDNIDIIKAAVPLVPWSITTTDGLVQAGGYAFYFNIVVPPADVGSTNGIFIVEPTTRNVITDADWLLTALTGFISGSLTPTTASPVFRVGTKSFYSSTQEFEILITASDINAKELTRSAKITMNPNPTPPAPPPPPPVPAQGNFSLWGSSCPGNTGEVQIAFITARTNGGTVWGPLNGTDDIFTDDSDWSRAIVHAGLASPGQTVEIKFTCQGNKTNYIGSSKNGVTTSNYGTWCGVKIELA